jgi:predicted Zn-dependent protease
VRQDTLEPPRLAIERGAMLTAMTDGGYGYCATSDLSVDGLQGALDRASAWAQATRAAGVARLDPCGMPVPVGEYHGPLGQAWPERSLLIELLAEECRRAKIDDRIVERHAAL